MSGFVPYVFTDQQLVDIRRFCGFPTRSNGAVLFPAPWVNIQYLALEYRLANISSDEAGVVITTYLANLYTLESAIPGAGANLSTDQAAVWTHNKNEVRDRMALFNMWRRYLCEYLGIEPGPGLIGHSGNSISMVV